MNMHARKRTQIRRLTAVLGAASMLIGIVPVSARAAAPVTVREKYLYSGASHSKYTNEAYYAAPIVTDLDRAGGLEIISVSGAVTVTDAVTGQTKWRVNGGKDRQSAYETESYGNAGGSLCNPVVRDIDKDGWKEIISVHRDTISVLDYTGYFKKGWPKTLPINGSIRSLAVEDLDGDGTCEIVVGAGVPAETSVWVFDCYGNLFPNWPQLSDAQKDQAESYGVFANGISTGDIDGDGDLEIIVPTDNRCIQAYNLDGSLVMANREAFGNSSWGSIRTYIDYDHEKLVASRGWDTDQGKTDLRERLCAEFGHSGSVFDDLDGDGKKELVVTGIVMDTANIANSWWLKSEYMTVFIFNDDRTRYVNQAKGFDWTTPPRNLGMRLKDSTDSVSSYVLSEPVVADLDGDGYKEILLNAYDGKLYCFGLDQKQRVFTLPASTQTIAEYASEPVCVDINGDGKLEIIFGSWTDSRTHQTTDPVSENTGVNGSLYILDSNLNLISRTQLPKTYPGYLGSNAQTNGVKSAPAVVDIDGDGQYEVVLNTTYRSVCVYDLLGSTTRDTPFSDLQWHWSKKYVMSCVNKGYLAGTSSTTFSPNGSMTRGMAATVMHRVAGSPAVSGAMPDDVDSTQWYAKGAAWAVQNGLVRDTGDNSFYPDRNITREELAFMLYQYKKAPSTPSADLGTFADAGTVSDWAADAMQYCVGAGIISGSEGKLNPAGTTTRAEVATMLARFITLQ